MLFAVGWVVVRSSREAYRILEAEYGVGSDEFLSALDGVDDVIHQTDERLFDELEAFLADFGPPGLAWHFCRYINNERGILTFYSSSNHRGMDHPWPVDVLLWLAQNGPGSYGLVYLSDDEDFGDAGRSRGRDGTDHSNEFRVWRLLNGKVEELDDPFLSPIVPRINPSHYA